MPTLENATLPGHDPDLHASGGTNTDCAAEERQRRRKTHPPSENRNRSADARRMLGLEMIQQLRRDVERELYKDVSNLQGADVDGPLSLADICALAGVSERRVKDMLRGLIARADGPLAEREYADPEDLRADDRRWVAATWLCETFGFYHDAPASWCRKEHVTAIKVPGPGGPFWHLRVDPDLRARLAAYWDRSNHDGDVPALDLDEDKIQT